MASAASSYSDLFGSWPKMAQRVQTQASGPSSRQVGETGYTGDVRSSAANVRHGGGAYSQQSPYSGVDVVPETQMSSAAHRSQGLALSPSSDNEFGVGREVDMPVQSGVTPCGD